MDVLLQTLQTKFRLAEFRPRQRDIIEDVLTARDTLCVMPTGAGKSLCFQLPAVVRGGLTVVISPLISLMADQARQLKQLGIPALILNSTQTSKEQRDIVRQLVVGFEGLLYVAPERFATPSFQSLATRLRPRLFVVDEAHCISSWGHDFRPEYMRLSDARRSMGDPVCFAVTATATPQVRRDIVERLALRSPRIHVTGFDRPNLNYTCKDFADEARKDAALVSFVRQAQGSGIVYCSTRKKTEAVAALLEDRMPGRVIVCYHGGMELPARHSSQSLFMKANEAVAVATNAFGMGINKPDIRFVLHYNLPGSVEAYYQEAGRAGRDGKPADCRLLYLARDRRTQEFFIEKMGENNPDLDPATLATLREHATTKLWKMVDYASKPVCRRRQILDYFGDTADVTGCRCDVCASSSLREPVLRPARVEGPSMIMSLHILHAVKETEWRGALGVSMLARLLRGESTKAAVPTSFTGALIGHRREEIENATKHMIEEGLLRQDDVGNGYPRPVIRLTERGKELVAMHPTPPPKAPPRASGDFEDCFKRLRVWRSGIARQRGIAAFCIFHDSTLKTLAERQPVSLDELRGIPGIGAKKLADYGDAVLRTIADR
jgi:ATP-dependent DNA helicase RecQ